MWLCDLNCQYLMYITNAQLGAPFIGALQSKCSTMMFVCPVIIYPMPICPSCWSVQWVEGVQRPCINQNNGHG